MLISAISPLGSTLPQWSVPWAVLQPLQNCSLSARPSAHMLWALLHRLQGHPWQTPPPKPSHCISEMLPAWASKQRCWPPEGWRLTPQFWMISLVALDSVLSTVSINPNHCPHRVTIMSSSWRSRILLSSDSQPTWACTGWWMLPCLSGTCSSTMQGPSLPL